MLASVFMFTKKEVMTPGLAFSQLKDLLRQCGNTKDEEALLVLREYVHELETKLLAYTIKRS